MNLTAAWPTRKKSLRFSGVASPRSAPSRCLWMTMRPVTSRVWPVSKGSTLMVQEALRGQAFLVNGVTRLWGHKPSAPGCAQGPTHL